jgi:hypothetical protein
MIAAKIMVAYWHPKGHNTTTMCAKFVTRLHEKVPVYSLVRNWVRCLHFDKDILELRIHSRKPPDGPIHWKSLTEQLHFLLRVCEHSLAHSRSRGPRHGIVHKRAPLLLNTSDGFTTGLMT